VKPVSVAPEEQRHFREIGQQVWQELVGRLYPADLLEAVSHRDCAAASATDDASH